MYNFVTFRPLDTGDDKDTAFTCGTTTKFEWSSLSTSAEFAQHDHEHGWYFTLSEDCMTVTAAAWGLASFGIATVLAASALF